jgi:aminoglycoside phosphotransferase (APT) family kinase protein
MTPKPDTAPTLDEHAAGLRAWVERCAGGELTRAERHAGGSHRIAWQVDAAGRELFLTLDAPGSGGEDGNARDAAVLSALAASELPVPALIGRDGPGGALLMERVAGRSDAPSGDDLEPVMSDLMRHMAALHALEPGELSASGLRAPSTPTGLAFDQLEPLEATYLGTPAAHHPLIDFGLGWLWRHAPQSVERVSLVHGDIGPGNMLYAEGRVSAIIDWEIAHLGDPMEDLAALNTRDMSTPIGDFARRLAQYEAAGGARLDVDRLRYYRALVLIRNSLLIRLTLANSDAALVPDQLGAFALLLRRAATQALCEAHGFPLPPLPTAMPDVPIGEHDDDALWIPILAARAQLECEEQRDLMGPLFEGHLQAVPDA